ncbi:MAG: MMPL family transporter, partial [Oscillospiraceae bacterium]
MHKIAKFIVDSRKLIMVIFLAAALLSVYTSTLTVVEDDLYRFLPEDTETRQGLNAMEGEFITYATAKVMVRDIPFDDAERLAQDIRAADGIRSVSFDDSRHHYKDGCALFDVTFSGTEDEELSIEALDGLRELLSDSGEVQIYTEVGEDLSSSIVKDMIYVGVLVVIIVTALLLLTSRSYAEVPVLIITFVAAAVLQLGTNFIFDSISYVSNAVTLILQLALAIDYAVILCNRFAEEKQHLGQYDAMVEALAKAIPEISSSSLTTIGGLIAMTFMQFGLGGDLGKVLIKSIIFSMLSVFLLMPGLLMAFGKAIEKTKHRSFVPRIDAVGRFAWKTRKILPPVFICIALASLYFANRSPLSYNYSDSYPVRLNESQTAHAQIVGTFGESNTMALVVPSGDYETEAKMLDEIAEKEHVTSVLGIASVEVFDGFRLG